MNGGDADVVDAPLDTDDADTRDIDAASALENFASPLKCITVAARWPLQPCFGSVNSILRRSNGKRRYPRLGFCFWETQDRCDDCKRPTCHLHGRKHNRPRSIARRFTPRRLHVLAQLTHASPCWYPRFTHMALLEAAVWCDHRISTSYIGILSISVIICFGKSSRITFNSYWWSFCY